MVWNDNNGDPTNHEPTEEETAKDVENWEKNLQYFKQRIWPVFQANGITFNTAATIYFAAPYLGDQDG